MKRMSARCGGCRILISFEVDDNGYATIQQHGPKMACPMSGKTVQIITAEIEERLKLQTANDAVKAAVEKHENAEAMQIETRRRVPDPAVMAAALLLGSSMPNFGEAHNTEFRRPPAHPHRRFPLPNRKKGRK